MKVRSQRTHFSGISNRDKQGFDSSTNIKTQSVFQRSFNKSKSLYTKSLIDTGSLADRKMQDSRGNPLAGFHHQFDTQRFDKMNIKPYKYQKMKIPKNHPMITFAPQLNSQIKHIQQQFNGRPINLHKLDQLKHTFIKNNRDRRNLQTYFDNYAKNGIVDFNGLKKIVKDYGFDINQDEAKLIFRLTNKANKTDQEKEHLTMDGFVQLMTKDDVYYQTMQLNQSNIIGGQNPQITFSKNFTDKVHEVLRNKFPKLKQAFKIYRQRNQEVSQKQYDYVMKKLDLTDLVLTQGERQQVFNKFSNQKGQFNVQGLICAIAEQQHQNRKSNAYKTDFLKDIQANQEMDFVKSKKIRGFSLKDLSSLEYENQFNKARAVIEQLQRIRKRRKQNSQQADIFKNIFNDNYASRQQVVKNAEKILKKQGINFQKQDYEAFGAYLNIDSSGNIPVNKVSQQLFTQTQKQARERFERKIRSQAPKGNLNQNRSQISDEKTAISCLHRIKSHKMNPQTRELFKFLDQDKDGYVSAKQFKQKISAMHIMENWQLQNLADYLKVNDEGSINYNQFSSKLDEVNKITQSQFPIVRNRNSKSCYDWSQTTKIRKTFINDSNQTAYQRPTKFSAWPSNITTQNLTLVQAPSNAATYASEAERFNQRKQDYGLKQKMFAMAVAQSRRVRKAEWNSVLQQRADLVRQKQQQRAAARNYALRLTKQKYELNCHQ